MLRKILTGLAVIVAVFIGVVAMQPSEFRIARTGTISATAAVVFAQVNDFHNWEAWSPYAKLDPAMKKTYEGAPAGTGAIYTWAGNNEVGEGRTTIIKSRPNELISIKLEFVRPFAGTSTAEFTFKPEGNQTGVTWSLTGKNNFIAKAIGLFMNMDKMVGGQFEQGLAQLKSVVEAAPSDSAATLTDKTMADTTKSVKKRDLVVTRVFDAPVERVWKAWSDTEHVMRWWGPNGFTSPVAKIDFREGGTSLVCMRSPEYGDLYSTWRYREIVPMKRIEYIHNLADKDGNKADPVKMGMPPDFPQDQRHVVTFKDLGDGKTELTVTEHDWTVGQMMEMSKMGMEQCLNKMAASLK